jgi:hypothetical protein
MKKKIASLFAILLYAGICYAQPPSGQMFAVIHDDVNPAMTTTYKDALKKLKGLCEQHKSPLYWTTVSFDDNSFSHMIPIKAMADMDKNMMADLEQKAGKEALAAVFKEIDKSVEKNTSYFITSVPSLSYLSPAPGENFRDILFWYPLPGKDEEAQKIIQEWLTLYKSKNAPSGVLTFKSVFGTEPGYAFVAWGKNPADLAAKDQKNNELFGDAAAKLWERTLAITKHYNNIRAWVLPDHSNMQAPAVAVTK